MNQDARILRATDTVSMLRKSFHYCEARPGRIRFVLSIGSRRCRDTTPLSFESELA